MYSMMELKDLRLFAEVVRCGGFSEAARANAVSQSAVSKAVKQVETDAGFVLLQRGRRAPNRLTDAGQIVHRRALRLLGERADLAAELDELRGLRRGVLRLGLPRVGAGVLFAPVFAEYRRRHPEIELVLLEQGSERLEQALLAGEVDLAALLPRPRADVVSQLVASEPLVAVLPTSHRLAARTSVTMHDLRETPFILFDNDFALHRIITDAARDAGITPQVSAITTQSEFMIELVAGGVGVAFLPQRIVVDRHRPDVAAVPLASPALDWQVHVAWRRGSVLPPAAEAWLELVRARLGASAPGR